MVTEKRAILLSITNNKVEGDGAAFKKFMNKAAVLANFNGGEVLKEAAAVEDAVATDVNGLDDALANRPGFVAADLGETTPATLETAIATALEAADRLTLLVLAANESLYLYGNGIKRGAAVDREAFAPDVVPTICYVADLPVPAEATGAILYQALKDPNLKLKEIQKLKDGLARMEEAIARESREPWDKHDCA